MYARQALYPLSYITSFDFKAGIQPFMFRNVFSQKTRHCRLTKFRSMCLTTEKGAEKMGPQNPSITELMIQETTVEPVSQGGR